MNADKTTADEAWQRYGRAVITAMREVLEEADNRHRDLLLEAADFWLGLGLVIGLERRGDAEKLLRILEGPAGDRTELLSDAEDLLAEALR